MWSNNKKAKRGFTIFELLVSLMIIAIMASALFAMKGSFSHRQQLMLSALKLANDLRLTQQFSRTCKDGYKYYGLRFYGNLGPDGDRDGYKIVRYHPHSGTQPIDDWTPVADLTPTGFDVIKTSVQADVPSPLTYEMFIEDTFFAKRVQIKPATEFQVGDAIVFNPNGSATLDGFNLLGLGKDEIVLSMGDYSVTIEITPLTGYVKIR